MLMTILRAATMSLLGLSVFLAAGSQVSAQGQTSAAQQVSPVVRRGDAVVTGFAGTLPPGPDLPIDVHPLDRTMIDLDGVTVRVFDLTQLGGGPQGQLSDAPVRFAFKARDLGHVFGVAFDGDGKDHPANIYLTATSIFGLQLVAPGQDGKLQRVITGRPGAKWMSGLFGDAKGGGPGSIWKVDGQTGAVSLFADIKTGDLENSGAGLGSIAFDSRSRHFYVSDMETGLIWRLDMQGHLLDVFDHGTQGRAAAGLALSAYDPAFRTDHNDETFNTEVADTWGFAPPERRIWALAIENNRLYYSVAEGPKVWSVGLKPDGTFANDARVEIEVSGTPAGNQISTILFDGPGTVYLSQRGGQLGSYDYAAFMRPQESMAMRYHWNETARRWEPAYQEYAVGLTPEYHGTVGGLALNYGYDRFGNVDYGRCRQTLWLTGEHLRNGSDIVRVARGGPAQVNGLQGIYKNRVKPDNEPPFEAWYVDFDANYSEEQTFGHVGNVAIFGPCESSVTYSADTVEIPVWTKGPNITIEKVCYPGLFGGRFRCVIRVRNTGDATPSSPIEVIEETRTLWGEAAGQLLPIAEIKVDGAGWTCSELASGAHACVLDAALLGPGLAREFTVWVDTHDLVLAGNLGFRNCAILNHKDGKGKACAEGGGDIVIEKVAPAYCKPGEDCAFKIKLSNQSHTAFEGEVLLGDSMFLGGKSIKAPIAEIEPPLGCTNDPTSLPFSCLAKVKLAPGETHEHTILVEMPDKSPVWAANCIAAFEPTLGAEAKVIGDLLAPDKFKGEDKPLGHPACVWVKIDDKKPVAAVGSGYGSGFLPTHGFIPPLALCADGRRPLPSGRCPCPLSAPWDPDTGSCRVRPFCWDKARLRPDGACCPRGTVWWDHAQRCRPRPVVGCYDVWRRRPDGACCPRGTRWRDGACRRPDIVTPCGPGYIRLLNGICIKLPIGPIVTPLPRCPDGRLRLANRRCPPIVCPLNAPFNARTGRCEKLVVDGRGCKPGEVRLPGNGRCVPIVRCPATFVRNAAGQCVPPILGGGKGPVVCKKGQRLVNGRCFGIALPLPFPLPPKVGKPVFCPGGFVVGKDGKCVPRGIGIIGRPGGGQCGPGQKKLANGKCVGIVPGKILPIKPPIKPPIKVAPIKPPFKPPIKVAPIKPPKLKVTPVKPPKLKVRPIVPPKKPIFVKPKIKPIFKPKPPVARQPKRAVVKPQIKRIIKKVPKIKAPVRNQAKPKPKAVQRRSVPKKIIRKIVPRKPPQQRLGVGRRRNR